MDYVDSAAAVFSALAAGGALEAARRSLKTADRAAQTGEAAARTAETVARIERDRWHAEVEPRLEIAISAPPSLMMTVRFTGPTALRRLARVEMTIRNHDEHHGHGLAGSPTEEELAAVIWGPLRFRPHINEASEDGRTAGVFPLELGEICKRSMDETLAPHWQSDGHAGWQRKWVNEPVRLWVVCHADGHRPWHLTFDVIPEEDVASTFG